MTRRSVAQFRVYIKDFAEVSKVTAMSFSEQCYGDFTRATFENALKLPKIERGAHLGLTF